MKILFSLLFASCSVLAAPDARVNATHGELENGLHYYLKPVPGSSEAELRLLVNAGSLDEGKGEEGIAHLIEHMAFRQTRHFGKDEIKALLNENGLRLGGDSNAFTQHESTIYTLKLKAASFERGLQLLADWANGEIKFDKADLQTERQIVLDEMRLSQDGSKDWRDYLNVLYPNSSYPLHMPIGNEEAVKGLPASRITALYRKMYQPQRISVIAAGAVPADAEQKIQALFSLSPKGKAASHYAAQPLANGPRLYLGNPPPWPQDETAVSWNYKLTTGSDEQTQQQLLALLCMQQRLQKIATQASQAISQAQFIEWSGMVGRERYYTLYAATQGKAGDALQQLYREIHRAKSSGFTEAEVAEARQLILNGLSRFSSLTPAQWADSLLGTARMGTATRGVAEGKAWFETLTFSAESVNATWQSLNTTPDQLAIVMYPKNKTINEYWDDSSLNELISKVDAEQLAPLQLSTSKPLLATEPERGRILSRQQQGAATLFSLANGAEVLIRPRRQAEERIGISAMYAGGMLALPSDQQAIGMVLPLYMNRSGLGSLNYAEVLQALSSADLQLEPWLEADRHGFSGTSTPSALSSVMQLLYLNIAQARTDHAAQKQALEQAKQSYWQDGGPGPNAALFSNWPYQNWYSGDFDIANTARLDEWRSKLFSDPSKLRLVLTGVPSIPEAQDLVERYIASLPAQNSPALASPRLVAQNRQGTSKPNHSTWSIVINKQQTSTQTAFMAEALLDLLQQRMFQSLREKSGHSYDVRSYYQLSPSMGLVMHAEYSSSHRQCLAAAAVAADELKKMARLSVSDSELKAMQERMQQGIDNAPNQPYWYAKSQAFHWVNNTDFAWLNPKPEHILSRDLVNAASKAWFTPANWYLVADGCKPDLTTLRQ